MPIHLDSIPGNEYHLSVRNTHILYELAHDKTKNKKNKKKKKKKKKKYICAQRRPRSAWASAQSDQNLRSPHEENFGP